MPRHDRFRERHGRGVAAGGADHDMGVEPRPAGAPRTLGHERHRETALFERAPELLGPHALLGRLDELLGDEIGEEPGDGIREERAELAHRSPSPRAMIPRSTSRVPPRSENDGATCVMY